MKTTKKFFLAAAAVLAAVCCAFGFAACEHEHAFKETWSTDETAHWHACIVPDCTQKNSVEDHTFGEWEVFIPATEQAGGQEKRTCSVCEYAELRSTDKLTQKTCDHDWSDWTVTDANKPTASAVGKATRTCANDGCDAKAADKEYALPALSSEEYTKGADSATCTSEGTVEYSYDKDGVKVTFQVATSTKPHSLTHVDAEPASCTENGTLEHWTCSVCENNFSDAKGENELNSTVDPAAHSWGEWKEKTPATCTAAKVEERVCAKNPEHTETRPVGEPAGHKWNDGEVTTPATCTEEGEKTFTCTVNGCGETKTEPVAANGHSWDEGEVTKQPTESTPGVKTFTCTVNGCGETKTQPVPELGHEHSYTGEWQKDGDGHWKVCDGANCVETDYQDEHDWDDGEVTTPATCSAQGVKTFTCETCGYEKTEPVPVIATAHSWGNWTEKTPATCTAAKVEERVCAHNNEHTETRTAGTALGHDFSWTVTTNPTNNGTGVATKSCSHSGCDVTEEKVLPALSTAGVYTVSGDTANCTEDGTANYQYAFEGGEVTFTAVTHATGHKWGEWTVNIDDDGGEATKTCTNDGCQEYKHTDLPALSEKDQYEYENSATCEMPGNEVYIFVYSDDDGSEYIQVKNEEVPAKGHDWDEWTEKTPATCITGKVEERVCLRDEEHTETRTVGEVNLEAHEEKTLNVVEATCTEDGLTEGKMCLVCLKILEEQAVVKAKGHSLNTTTPSVNETDKTVSNRCTVCNKTVVYEYDNAVLNASGSTTNAASGLSDGVNYVTQNTANPYLSYTFEEAGTYTIYWVGLNNSTFSITTVTFGTTSNGFISSSGAATTSNMPNNFAFEGYYTGTSAYKYYVTDENGDVVLDEDGKKIQAEAQKGDYVRLVKNSILTTSISSFVPVKLTFDAAADSTLKFRTKTSATGGCFLVGVNKEPTIAAELCSVGAGNFTVKDTELEFTKITEDTVGTYTFTAKTGKFELYVNDELYSDDVKSYFGYVDFCDRYLTVNLKVDDVVKVVKLSNKASDNTVTIHEGELEEPAESEYNTLELGEQTITLSSTNRTSSHYEGDGEVEATERFYSFTAAESGYYEISVADDVRVNVVIRVDRIHYTTVLDVVNMNKHSGVIYMEDGETVIIAFLNNDVEEFNVNIAPCEEPITYLEVNEKLENITFSGFESIVKLTVGDSVAEGTYKLTFKLSNSLLRSYIYFTIGEDIKVEDPYDSNGIAAYVNADVRKEVNPNANANNTVGAGTSDKSDWDEDFTRTITVKAGDVIYLATTALTPGYVDITLGAVAE